MHLLSQLVPDQNAASAQGLYSAAVGAAMGLTMMAAGPLYHGLGSGAYFVMAALSLSALAVTWRLRPHLVP
jgi:hypothetical protein